MMTTRREFLVTAGGAAMLPSTITQAFGEDDRTLFTKNAKILADTFNHPDKGNHVKQGNILALARNGAAIVNAISESVERLRRNGLDPLMQTMIENPNLLPALDVDRLIETMPDVIGGWEPGFDVAWLRDTLAPAALPVSASRMTEFADRIRASGWDAFHRNVTGAYRKAFGNGGGKFGAEVFGISAADDCLGAGWCDVSGLDACWYLGWGLFYTGWVLRAMASGGALTAAAPEAWVIIGGVFVVATLAARVACS